jgi:hypothetical protein
MVGRHRETVLRTDEPTIQGSQTTLFPAVVLDGRVSMRSIAAR